MSLGWLLVILGLVVAVLVHWGLGVLLLLLGLVLLLLPQIRGAGSR